MSIPISEPTSLEKMKHVFKHWVQEKTLLVFDDLELEEDYATIEPCIPSYQWFNTLITSRIRVDAPFQTIDLDVLTLEDSIALLENFITQSESRQNAMRQKHL